MGLNSFGRWISRQLGFSKKRLARREEADDQSVEGPEGVCRERVHGRLETSTVAPEEGRAPSQFGTREAEGPRFVSSTQFAGHGTDNADLVVGLDFGTLSTRVVVRSAFVGPGRAVPVRWRVRRGFPPHFLPAALEESSNGELSLTSDWSELDERNLKTDLMDHPSDLTARARAAAYLGLVLRGARAYVLDTQEQAYGSYRLRWAVHLGIPSAGYDDQEVKAAFSGVARAAWILSLRAESPTLEIATAELERAEHTEMIASDPDLSGVEVFPEIAALVVGYARSRRRREGLHVMVDVGASTMDVCGFGLRDHDGDDRYSLYTALVERIGIRELHRQRMNAIKAANAEQSLVASGALNPFSEVPAAGADYVNAPAPQLRAELDRLDERYAKDCAEVLMRVLMDLRRWRDPDSVTWTTGLPLFKAGGGARCGLITRAVRDANQRLTGATRTKGIDERPLPTLETLDDQDSPPEDYGQGVVAGPVRGPRSPKGEEASRASPWGDLDDLAGRLGVAYGLSFDKFEIGEIVAPHEIDDVPTMTVRKPNEYTSKDQV